ncbi:MAG: hypothetical protein ABEH89_00885 [bacterium]
MIKQRLLADMRDMKNQLTQLNKTVNQLKNRVNELWRENQKNKNRIRKLKRQIDRLRNTNASSTRSARIDTRSSVPEKTRTTRTDQPESEWMETPKHPYKIRRKALSERRIYVTTDDTTLTKLAHKYYRDAALWKALYAYNRDKLPSPSVIPPGVRLVLPPIDELKSR